ncbi:hypothetical protein [Roseateles sp.]|uniref:hypothetical protein n=1 Tax=Roseateles sp. TaxID=1971397 RepID=UPI002DFA6DE3|nr:hypothetical protein [Roseateles sp.]
MAADTKPPVEPGDIVMVDCRKPPGSMDAGWVPASALNEQHRKMSWYRERFYRLRDIYRNMQTAMFGERRRKSDDWDSSFPGPLSKPFTEEEEPSHGDKNQPA